MRGRTGWIATLLPIDLLGRTAADEPAKELTPEERTRLERRGKELDSEVVAPFGRGKRAEGLRRAEEACALREKVFPPARFPDRHPDLANSHGSLGYAHSALGRPAQALPRCERALA